MINRKFQDEFNISFEPFMQKKECMVNATEMANVFGKKVRDYLKSEKTQAFLVVLEDQLGSKKIASENAVQGAVRPLENENLDDNNDELSNAFSDNILNVIHGGRNNGTWMHRHLAIDFAMWLDPYFKYWVISTIEEILFGIAKIQDACIRKRVALQEERDDILAKPEKTDADYKRFFEIEMELRDIDSTKRKATNDRIQQIRMDLFDTQSEKEAS